MGFVVRDEYEVRWPVKVMVPQDGGGHVEQEFTGVFRYIEADAAERRRAEIRKLPAEQQGAANRALAADMMVGWEDVVEEPQPGRPVPVPYSRDLLLRQLQRGFYLRAVLDAYEAAFSPTGTEQRRQGN